MWVKQHTVIILVLSWTILLWSCAPSLRPSGAGSRQTQVRFVYVDAKATSVSVSGSFNQWSDRSHCMRREGNTWSITLSLSEGRYAYGFVVDGDLWQADPGATLSEDNGFGKTNSVLIVE